MSKETQMSIVKTIVKQYGPLRTEEVSIRALREGVSCGPRYLRWLREEGVIDWYKLPGDKTKTWTMTPTEKNIMLLNPIGHTETRSSLNVAGWGGLV